MSYTLAPFNPDKRYQKQVNTELNTANSNFTILGQAFYNNDPSSQPILRAVYVGSSAPSNPTKGTTWLDTSQSSPTLKVYDGSNWQVISGSSSSSNSSSSSSSTSSSSSDSSSCCNTLNSAFYNNDPSSQPVLRAVYINSSAPSNPVADTLWYDTSSNILKLYDGNNWQFINDLSNIQTQINNLNSAFISNDPTKTVLRATYIGSSAPSNPVAGTTWLDTSQSSPVLKVYDGSNWQTISGGSSSSSSNNRVDLTNATSDYSLSVGQEAIINFNNATSVPLHIAVNSTDVYWLYCSAGACHLNPNNTTYSNAFQWTDWGANNGSGTSGLTQDSSFGLGNSSGAGFIVSYIDIKNAKSITQHAASFSSVPYSIRHVACHWTNPVSWTSLGTITLPQSSSGYILVRRVA